jgi:hypothetical protein
MLPQGHRAHVQRIKCWTETPWDMLNLHDKDDPGTPEYSQFSLWSFS